MELPNVGEHCAERTCNRLDFLPMKCSACNSVFCSNHFSYAQHKCPNAYSKDVQVPVCPLCNRPIPVGKGQSVDAMVSAHMDRDCEIKRQKIFKNACNKKGCKKRELVPITCDSCRLNYCLTHRHTSDHDCKGFQGSGRSVSKQAAAAVNRNAKNNAIVGNMSEDEALARALQESLNTTNGGGRELSQEEQDRILAESLQQQAYQASSSSNGPPPAPSTSSAGQKSTCRVH